MKTDKAFKRVIKKLSAVRATLPNDEREVLDEIVTTVPEEEEVEGHRMIKAEDSAEKGLVRKAEKRQEVKGHRINPTAPVKSNAKQTQRAEVKAHRINPKAPAKSNAKQADRLASKDN